MSARQAARWKRAACPALARDSFSKSKIWRRNQGFGSHLGGLRVPVAQSSRWALAAPSARFAPSQISAFCALAARSPCICSHLRVALRYAQQPTGLTLPSGASEPPKGVVPPQKWWPSVVAGHARSSSVTAPPASKCGCGVCPAPQARAKRAPRATRATPAQAFRAPLRRKKRGLPLQQARRAIAPFALPPRQALPRLPLQAPGASHPARASVSSVRRTQETRLATPSLSGTPEPSAPHHPSEVWRAAALQAEIRIQRHARWIRQPCVSKATLRRFPPGSPPKEGEREAAHPGGKDRRQPSFSAERKLPRFRKFVHPQPPPDRELDHRRDGRGIQHAHQRPAEMPPVEGHAA